MSDAVRREGRQWRVKFVYDGHRQNLGLFDERTTALRAYRRRVTALARYDGSATACAEWRSKVAYHRNERRVSPRRVAEQGALQRSPVGEVGLQIVLIDGVQLYAHRVVFCAAHGRWPRRRLVWIDGDRSNLDPSNLRES